MRLNRRVLMGGLFGLVVLVMVLFFITKKTNGTKKESLPLEKIPATEVAEAQRTTVGVESETVNIDAKPEISVDDGVSETSDPSSEMLVDLARTYETGVLPVRIRLQDQLSRYWDENPPSAEELVGLVGDQTLPAELRSYLARTFANRVKMRAYSDEAEQFPYI